MKTFAICAFALSALALSEPVRANISAGEQLTGDGATIEIENIESCGSAHREMSIELLAPARISCSTKQGIEGFLSVTKITTSLISLGAACTPVGAPVVVAAGITGVASEMIELVVSNLECEDPSNSNKVDALIKQSVCSALNQKGFDCNPGEI